MTDAYPGSCGAIIYKDGVAVAACTTTNCQTHKDEDGEGWARMKEESQKKRWNNYEKSTGILTSRKIPFRVLNAATAHVRVDERFDFWPTTGVFIEVGTHKKGRGVFNLIKALNNISV